MEYTVLISFVLVVIGAIVAAVMRRMKLFWILVAIAALAVLYWGGLFLLAK